MIIDYLVQLVGELPEEVNSPDMLLWVLGCFVLIFLLCEVFAFLHNIFRSFLGG